MRKKVLSAVLAATMVAGMMGNVVSVSAEEKYDLTLYSVNTTDPDFDDWLANVEEATGLNINVIAAPTDTERTVRKRREYEEKSVKCSFSCNNGGRNDGECCKCISRGEI